MVCFFLKPSMGTYMLVQEIIRKKRDHHTLSETEISQYVKGIVDQSVGEGQIAAMCMAILLNGLNMDERVALTMAMARSGIVVEWANAHLDGPVLDKHSTGGVGDKVSLMLAPIIAACGGYVPMISGRGLGHTGGTLDKMDSIPGYVSQPDLPLLQKVVKEVGCAVVGATGDIAPADRTVYAVRDVTGTVESLDLITASILSKKLAAGLDGLVMDVKFGTGAFMQDYADATALARSIVSVANGAGLKCTALMTDMNQVLGRSAGNAVEVREAVQYLRNEHIDPRLYEVTMNLCAELLVIGGLATNRAAGLAQCAAVLESGKAAEYFDQMVAALGGPNDFINQYEQHLTLASHVRDVFAETDGIVTGVDTRAIGLAVIELGGGRRLVTDKIDHAVGLDSIAGIGAAVGPKAAPLARIYARDANTADRAERMIRGAFTTGKVAGGENPTLRDHITI